MMLSGVKHFDQLLVFKHHHFSTCNNIRSVYFAISVNCSCIYFVEKELYRQFDIVATAVDGDTKGLGENCASGDTCTDSTLQMECDATTTKCREFILHINRKS